MLPPVVTLLLVAAAGQNAPADLVIENARIWSDGEVAFAEFAAVRDGRFIEVGVPNPDLVGPETERVDARGRVVVPGLIDAHIHMLGGGRQLSTLPLRDSVSRRDFVQRVEGWAAQLEPGEWILGGRWSTESWSEPAQPTREWVDGASGDHPLYLERMDGHSALVNSKALRLAGVTRGGPPDPEGGVIDRDPATGAPTGILRDSAMEIVSRLIPEPTVVDQVEALRGAAGEAIANGITAVSDIPGLDELPAYEVLASSGPVVRFYLYPTAADWLRAAGAVRRFQGAPGWVEIRGLKAYLDGSMGSRTAFMHEPFLGNAPHRRDWRGLLREGIEDGRFERNVEYARSSGLQVIAHAIGDEANHLLLDVLEKVYGEDLAAARCRSEHVQHLLPEDIARFGALGVIASMQPYHKADDGRYVESYIGAERARSSYTYKSLLDTGAVLAFGSDWPVVTLNPFLGMEAAVTGRVIDRGPWQIQENITVAEALRCYTTRAAYAMFADHELGRIAPGYRADFVVLNRSPFDADVDWASIRPDLVFVEGELAFDAGKKKNLRSLR